MKTTLDKGLLELQVFGNSLLLVISWMKNHLQVHNNALLPLVGKLKENTSYFHLISLTHLYKALNTTTNGLPKVSIHIFVIQLLLEEVLDEQVYGIRQNIMI